VALDATGNVYVADAWNHRVNKFDANGTFLMIWGWGVRNGDDEFQVCTGGCMTGKQGDGDGQFSNPWDMVVDSAGNIWVAERSNNRIQKFDSGGNYLRHRGVWGSSAGQFKEPVGVAVDAAGNIFVTDRYNYRVQKFGGPWVEIFIGDPELLSGH
jgi:DNA-binding beta-propeller fold protein YncE